MLDPAEESAVADQFGVARPQVHRDHLISHLLAALSAHAADEVVFFGGTSLSRTFIPDGRLSEDIDLIAVHKRRTAAELVASCLVRGVRREYPGLRWEPDLTAVRDTEPAVLVSRDGLTVRVQLLARTGYPPSPATARPANRRRGTCSTRPRTRLGGARNCRVRHGWRSPRPRRSTSFARRLVRRVDAAGARRSEHVVRVGGARHATDLRVVRPRLVSPPEGPSAERRPACVCRR